MPLHKVAITNYGVTFFSSFSHSLLPSITPFNGQHFPSFCHMVKQEMFSIRLVERSCVSLTKIQMTFKKITSLLSSYVIH